MKGYCLNGSGIYKTMLFKLKRFGENNAPEMEAALMKNYAKIEVGLIETNVA